MLSIFKQKISLPFFQLTHKNFAQKQNLRRFKKLVETPRLKDFTNSFSVTSAINKKNPMLMNSKIKIKRKLLSNLR